MAGISAIHGVDDTLKKISKDAVDVITPTAPGVTIGSLDAGGTEARVNWFLYRIAPHLAFRNMEPPRTGWRTARGRPQLALELHYLLTAFPGSGVTDGDHEQFSHAAVAAVMQALNRHAVIAEGDPVLSSQATPLLEPLRITLESLDLEALSKIWTAAKETMRLSVGYQVSLVTVEDPEDRHTAGPPVSTRRVAVAPTLGPRFVAVNPARTSAGAELSAELDGLTAGAAFAIAREREDPAGGPDWGVTLVRPDGPRRVVLRLDHSNLAPGARRLEVRASENGLAVGQDSIGLTLVPRITAAPASAAAGADVTLTTAHAAPDVEVFLRGEAVSAPAVHYVSPTEVRVTVPPAAVTGPAQLTLRAGKTAGPAYEEFAVS